MRLKKQKKVRNIDLEIGLMKIDKTMNDFHESMQRDSKKSIKKLIVAMTPGVLGLLLFPIFKNVYILMSGTALTGIVTIIYTTKQTMSDLKNIDNAINSLEPESYSYEDYYTNDYKKSIEYHKTKPEELKKYEEVLAKQREQLDKKYEEDEEYTLDEAMSQLAEEVDLYCLSYKLPAFKIDNKDWDTFFETIYGVLEEKGIQKQFYWLSSELIRLVFAKILVNKIEVINMDPFIENLKYFAYKNEYMELTKEDIDMMKERIKNNLSKSKVVDFNDFSRRRKNKTDYK